MKKTIRIVLSLLVLLMVAYAGVSYYMMNVVTEPNVHAGAKIKSILNSKYGVNTEEIPLTTLALDTPDGMKIETNVYRNPKPSGKVIVLSHGIRQNGQMMLQFFNFYQSLGFDIVTFSYRNHGESTKSATTFGKYEVADLAAVMKYAHLQFGENVTYGIHGISMGSAIMIQYAAQNVNNNMYHYLISDCAFSDLGSLLMTRLKEDYTAISFLPLVQSASSISSLIGRGSFFDILPKNDIKKITVPMLFLHSEKDDYIPISHTKELYDLKSGQKEFSIMKNGAHAESYLTNKIEYEQALKKVIQ
ncbi:MAG: alpha/beta hydrolase [Culicoidibacterales bacterium]